MPRLLQGCYNLVFFIWVEKVTRQHLSCQYSSEKRENIKQLVIKAISEDSDVQFYWTLISQDIDEEDAIELLLDIADMWVTIRGFLLLQLGWRNTRN